MAKNVALDGYPRDVSRLRRRLAFASAKHEFAPQMLAEVLGIVVVTMRELSEEDQGKVQQSIENVRVLNANY